MLYSISQAIIPKREYELLLSSEQLSKISKFFNSFENTTELVNWLVDSIKQKKSNVKIDEKECIIQILNPISNKIIDLSLNLKKEDLNSRVSNLEDIVTKQNKEILFLKEKVKKLESILEGFIQEKEKEKGKEKKEDKLFWNSNIMNKEEKGLLKNWLPSNPNKTTLLFNSKNDGDSIDCLAKKILGKSPTLVVIKSKDGYKFGGYANQKWEKSKNIYDEKAFVFSLDKRKKYNIINPENSYYLLVLNWWGFGVNENAIVIVEKCTSSNKNFVGNKTYDIKEKYELNGGKEFFTVDSFEIFHIEY